MDVLIESVGGDVFDACVNRFTLHLMFLILFHLQNYIINLLEKIFFLEKTFYQDADKANNDLFLF